MRNMKAWIVAAVAALLFAAWFEQQAQHGQKDDAREARILKLEFQHVRDSVSMDSLSDLANQEAWYEARFNRDNQNN